jgi:hypothetical protein
MVCNASFLKETMEFFILTTPINLHSDELSIKFAFNKLLEIEKNLIHLRTFLSKYIQVSLL